MNNELRFKNMDLIFVFAIWFIRILLKIRIRIGRVWKLRGSEEQSVFSTTKGHDDLVWTANNGGRRRRVVCEIIWMVLWRNISEDRWRVEATEVAIKRWGGRKEALAAVGMVEGVSISNGSLIKHYEACKGTLSISLNISDS